MYSDWENRADVKAGAKEDVDADTLGEHQERDLQQPLTELTSDIFSTSVVNASSNEHLQIDVQ